MSRFLKWLAGILVTLAVLALVTWIATGPQAPPPDSPSSAWLESGPWSVGRAEFDFVDASRPTRVHQEVTGSPERTFPTTLWYPRNTTGQHPLIIHSHGLLSTRNEMTFLAEHLASHGYVVAAADYPLTSNSVPGGPDPADVVNQPADVSFLINSVIALDTDSRPFAGSIDRNRIGLTGLSLGGLTTTLATFHPRWRDPRVRAAVSIAGPASAFRTAFYNTSDAPFLMIAGTADSFVDYQSNAAIIPERSPGGALLTIHGGSHLGFIGAADPAFRFLHNPDRMGCRMLLAQLTDDPDEMDLALLGDSEEGIVEDPQARDLCSDPSPTAAIHPGRQHMITTIAVLAFFESVFAPTPEQREAARHQLEVSLAADFAEADYSNDQ